MEYAEFTEKAIPTIVRQLLALVDQETMATLAEKFFDEQIKPLDLPGPDSIFDPILRASIRPIVYRLYAAVEVKNVAAT